MTRRGEDQDAQSRAREERLDVLAGTRGDEADHALRVRDLDGRIPELVRAMILTELKKRGL